MEEFFDIIDKIDKINKNTFHRNPTAIIEHITNEQLLNVMNYVKNYLHTGVIDTGSNNHNNDNFNLYLIRNGLSAIDLERLMKEMLQNNTQTKKTINKDDSPLTNAGMQQSLYLNEAIHDNRNLHYDIIRQSTILTSYMRSSIETATLAMQNTNTLITPIPYTRQDKWFGPYDPKFSNKYYHEKFAKINNVNFNSDMFSEELMKNIFHDRTKMRFGRTSKQPRTNTHIGRISNITNYSRMFRRHFLKVLAITLIVSVIMIHDNKIALRAKQTEFVNTFLNKTYTLFTNSQFIRRITGINVDVHPIGIMKLICHFDQNNELVVHNNPEYICLAEDHNTEGSLIIWPRSYTSLTNNIKRQGTVNTNEIINKNKKNMVSNILRSNLQAYFMYFDTEPLINHEFSNQNRQTKYLGNGNFRYEYVNTTNNNEIHVFPLTLYTARMFKEKYSELLNKPESILNKSLNNLIPKSNSNSKSVIIFRRFAKRMLSGNFDVINRYIEQEKLHNNNNNRKRQCNTEAQRQRNAEANAKQRQYNTYQRVQRNQKARKEKTQVNITAEVQRRQTERRQQQAAAQRQRNAEEQAAAQRQRNAELKRRQTERRQRRQQQAAAQRQRNEAKAKAEAQRQETGVWFSGLFGHKTQVKPKRSNAEAEWNKAQQSLTAVNLTSPLLSGNNSDNNSDNNSGNNSDNNEVTFHGGKKKNKPKNKPKSKRKSKK